VVFLRKEKKVYIDLKNINKIFKKKVLKKKKKNR